MTRRSKDREPGWGAVFPWTGGKLLVALYALGQIHQIGSRIQWGEYDLAVKGLLNFLLASTLLGVLLILERGVFPDRAKDPLFSRTSVLVLIVVAGISLGLGLGVDSSRVASFETHPERLGLLSPADQSFVQQMQDKRNPCFSLLNDVGRPMSSSHPSKVMEEAVFSPQKGAYCLSVKNKK